MSFLHCTVELWNATQQTGWAAPVQNSVSFCSKTIHTFHKLFPSQWRGGQTGKNTTNAFHPQCLHTDTKEKKFDKLFVKNHDQAGKHQACWFLFFKILSLLFPDSSNSTAISAAFSFKKGVSTVVRHVQISVILVNSTLKTSQLGAS